MRDIYRGECGGSHRRTVGKRLLAKLGIAYKESRETIYWLRLLYATGMITAEMFEDIVSEAEEICKIIGKIQVTMKKKISIRIS